MGETIASVAAKPLAWVEAIEEAGRFALIHRDAENKSLYIHRLVQEVVKAGLPELGLANVHDAPPEVQVPSFEVHDLRTRNPP